MANEIERAAHEREAAPRPLSDVLSGMADARADGAWRASRAWYAANGDIERAHTTGTFVREPRAGEAGPVLVVYVDSKARATDFAANSAVYLARLAHAGVRFSKVEFRLSRYPRRERADAPRARRAPRDAAPEAPTPAERAEIDELCSTLPEALRASVSKAMCATYGAAHAKRQ